MCIYPAAAQSGSYSGPTYGGTGVSGPNPAPNSAPIPFSTGSSVPGYGGAATASSNNTVYASGGITTSFTWTGTDPVPQNVIVTQTCVASWSSSACLTAVTGTCDNGLKGPKSSSGPTRTPTTHRYYASGTCGNDTNGNPLAVYSVVAGASTLALKTVSVSASITGSDASGSLIASASYTAAVSPVTITLGGTLKDSNGNPVLDGSGNQQILVGQGCGATLGGIPSGCTVSNYQWSVHGATFQDWEPTTPQIGTTPANSQASYYDPGPGVQTNPTYHWYWNDSTKTTEAVTCTATVTPPAGQGSAFSVTATQKVTVYVPSWTAANSTGYGYVGYPNSSQSIELYAGPSAAMQQKNQKDGSVWDTTVLSPLAAFTGAGQWGYAQIINPGETFEAIDASRASSTDTGVPALDNTFPYAGTHALDGGKQEDSDAPALPLNDAFAEVFMTDQFKTYLMFRPSGTDTRWVPLAETGWDTEFDAKEPGTGHWANYPANTSAGPVLLIFDFKPQNVYPSWTKVLPKGTPLFH